MDKYNFYDSTRAVWAGCKRPSRKPDYISYNRRGEISSEYWYTPEGVIRCSNHWSKIFLKREEVRKTSRCFSCKRVAKCWWELRTTKENTTCGFCKWTGFSKNKRK